MSNAARNRPLAALPTTPVSPVPSPAATPARGPGLLVDVVVLSGDFELFQATRDGVGERNPVWRARSAEEAAELLITGRCGVLLIDMGFVSVRADTLIEQIVEQFPEVVVCVAGTRADEPLLAPLISDGLVYRFMHKPATARRAGMFLQAAIRRHVERRGGAAEDTLLPLLRSLTRPRAGIPRKYLLLLALACAAAASLPFVGGNFQDDASIPVAVEPEPAPTVAAAAPVDPTSNRADPVLSRARAALQAGRLESPQGRNALDLFEAVLLAQPEHLEARAGLVRTMDRLLERARKEAAGGHRAEAERLLQRILAVDPRHAGAKALVRQVSPPDLPSRQLAREQVAEVRRQALEQQAVRTPAPQHVPVPLPLPAANASPKPAVVRQRAPEPDPLAPQFTNTPPPKRVASWRRQRGPSAPIPNRLPIAGFAADVPEPRTAAPHAPAPEAAPGPVWDFDPIVAPDPVYPAQALRDRTRGWVELEFTVNPAGGVQEVQVVAAEPRGVFETAALDALAQWRFPPRVVNGQPVSQRSTITLRFDVDD